MDHLRRTKANKVTPDSSWNTIDKYFPIDKRTVSSNCIFTSKVTFVSNITENSMYFLTVRLDVTYNHVLWLVVSYPPVLNNTLINPKYIATDVVYSTEVKDIVKEIGKGHSRYLLDPKDTFLNIPVTDTWFTARVSRKYTPLVTVLLTLGTNRKNLGKLKDLPGIKITEAYLNYMMDTDSKVTKGTGCVFKLDLFENDTLYPGELTLEANGDLTTSTNLNYENNYRIVLSLVKDIEAVSEEEYTKLLKHLEPAILDFKNNNKDKTSNLLTYDGPTDNKGRVYDIKKNYLIDKDNDAVSYTGDKLKDMPTLKVDTEWVSTNDNSVAEATLVAIQKLPLPENYHTGIPPTKVIVVPAAMIEPGIKSSWGIAKPLITITGNVSDITTMDGTIRLSPYTPLSDYPGTHTGTEWIFDNGIRIKQDDDLVVSNIFDKLDLFKPGSSIKIKARYKSDYTPAPKESPWTDVFTFPVPEYGIAKFEITLKELNNKEKLEIQAPFVVKQIHPVGPITKVESKLTILDDTNSIVHTETVSGGKDKFVIELNTLTIEKNYKIQVEHKVANATVELFNNEVRKEEKEYFYTAAVTPPAIDKTKWKIKTPTVSYGTGITSVDDFDGMLYGSNYAVEFSYPGSYDLPNWVIEEDGVVVHTSTSWVIIRRDNGVLVDQSLEDTENKTTWTPTVELDGSTDYIVKVTYHVDNPKVADLTVSKVFTTAKKYITTPKIKLAYSPDGTRVLLQAEEPTVHNSDDTVTSTSWVLKNNADTILSEADRGDKLEFDITGKTTNNTQYLVTAVHNSEHSQSDKSFLVIYPFLENKPYDMVADLEYEANQVPVPVLTALDDTTKAKKIKSVELNIRIPTGATGVYTQAFKKVYTGTLANKSIEDLGGKLTVPYTVDDFKTTIKANPNFKTQLWGVPWEFAFTVTYANNAKAVIQKIYKKVPLRYDIGTIEVTYDNTGCPTFRLTKCDTTADWSKIKKVYWRIMSVKEVSAANKNIASVTRDSVTETFTPVAEFNAKKLVPGKLYTVNCIIETEENLVMYAKTGNEQNNWYDRTGLFFRIDNLTLEEPNAELIEINRYDQIKMDMLFKFSKARYTYDTNWDLKVPEHKDTSVRLIDITDAKINVSNPEIKVYEATIQPNTDLLLSRSGVVVPTLTSDSTNVNLEYSKTYRLEVTYNLKDGTMSSTMLKEFKTPRAPTSYIPAPIVKEFEFKEVGGKNQVHLVLDQDNFAVFKRDDKSHVSTVVEIYRDTDKIYTTTRTSDLYDITIKEDDNGFGTFAKNYEYWALVKYVSTGGLESGYAAKRFRLGRNPNGNQPFNKSGANAINHSLAVLEATDNKIVARIITKNSDIDMESFKVKITHANIGVTYGKLANGGNEDATIDAITNNSLTKITRDGIVTFENLPFGTNYTLAITEAYCPSGKTADDVSYPEYRATPSGTLAISTKDGNTLDTKDREYLAKDISIKAVDALIDTDFACNAFRCLSSAQLQIYGVPGEGITPKLWKTWISVEDEFGKPVLAKEVANPSLTVGSSVENTTSTNPIPADEIFVKYQFTLGSDDIPCYTKTIKVKAKELDLAMFRAKIGFTTDPTNLPAMSVLDTLDFESYDYSVTSGDYDLTAMYKLSATTGYNHLFQFIDKIIFKNVLSGSKASNSISIPYQVEVRAPFKNILDGALGLTLTNNGYNLSSKFMDGTTYTERLKATENKMIAVLKDGREVEW